MKIRDLLGTSVYALRKYGVSPDDDVESALRVLRAAAPHLAELVEAVFKSRRLEPVS
jgi:hypothetical protein